VLQTSAAVYPLISRVKSLRPFKSNLNNLISALIKTLSLTPILYATSDNTAHSTPLLPLILNWLQTMASSPLRPIRHTSTYFSLKINSALCEVAAEVSKDLALRQRQRDAEAKKGTAGAAAQKRVKDAEKKVNEIRERKAALEGFMQDIFDV
jgi:cohesin complex subunit SA-1/2